MVGRKTLIIFSAEEDLVGSGYRAGLIPGSETADQDAVHWEGGRDLLLSSTASEIRHCWDFFEGV